MHTKLCISQHAIAILIACSAYCNAQPTSDYGQQSDATCNINIGDALQTLIDTVNAQGQRLENMERTIKGLTTSSTSTTSTPICPTDFLQVKTSAGSHCYAVISTTMWWNASYQACITRNSKAHLVMVDNAVENNLLMLPFESVSDSALKACTDGANQTWYWTAGQTANPSTHSTSTFYWKYVDGTGHVDYSTLVTYTNWWGTVGPSTDPVFTSIMIGGSTNAWGSSYLKWATNPVQTLRCALCEIDMQ